MPKKQKTVTVNFRCPVDVLRAMKRLAKRDHNTLTDMIVPLLSAAYAPPALLDSPPVNPERAP
jgi:hypothetical protein